MNPLSPAGVFSWSSVGALGKAHSASGADWFIGGSQQSGLRSHENDFGVPGFSGRYPGDLPPLPRKHHRRDSRSARLLHLALGPLRADIEKLRTRWGKERIAIVLGSSTGGIDATETALRRFRQLGSLPDDYHFRDVHPHDSLLELLRGICGLAGPTLIVSTACSSAGKALASAQRLLHAGHADAALVGGADALCEMTVRGFSGLGVLSEAPCHPFDESRSGISIGEGASLILLEADSDAEVRLLGTGESSDAYHATAPHPEGIGAELAMRRCLIVAGLVEGDVDYLNAHGTGTEKNDAMEARAISRVWKSGICFSSSKGKTGHQLGTAGATEAVVCIEAIKNARAPAGLDPSNWDPRLSIHSSPAPRTVNVALSNSFAFGGSNVTVALGRTNTRKAPSRVSASKTFVDRVALWSPEYPHVESWTKNSRSPWMESPPAALLSARARGRASVLTRTFAQLYEELVPEARSKGEDCEASIPTIYASCFGEMETTLTLLDQIAEDQKLSPIRFQASVHNSASGRISLETNNRSFTTALAAGQSTFAMALLEGQAWLAAHGGEVVVMVADETLPPRLEPHASFAPLGAGLRLSAKPSHGSLAALGPVSPAEEKQTAAFEDLGKRPPRILDPYLGAPPLWGLLLIDAILSGRSGEPSNMLGSFRPRYVGPRWTVEWAVEWTDGRPPCPETSGE